MKSAAGLPYENATAGDKAIAECERILARFGCERFGTMTDNEGGFLNLQFDWRGRRVSVEASWKGYAALWLKAHPYSSRSRGRLVDHERKALEQAKVSVRSILRDWIKGQTMAIESGLLSFEAAFLGQMMLPSGERLVDVAVPMLRLTSGDQSDGTSRP